MKKLSLILVALLVLTLCGCSLAPTGTTSSDVETLKGWSFQYNEGTNDYSVFFALLTKAGRYTSADVDVDIRIVNDDGVEVYNATHTAGKDDYDYYTSQIAGEQYLANIRIPASKIAAGTNSSGKVYLRIYKGDSLLFDEVNCNALYCLPILDVKLITEGLPVEINVKGYNGKVESKIQVENVTYLYDKDYTSILKIAFTGAKTFGVAGSLYDIISYKIYDSQGYVVDSGNVYLSNLVEGDKFKDDTIVVYDVTPGETYTIKFFEYSW